MPDLGPLAPTLVAPHGNAARKPSDLELIATIPLGPPLKANDIGSLGPYRVIRLIGRGGMGMVFLGVDPKLRRKVALKVMLPKFLAKPSARERFFREARAVAAVKNDHVVTIYSVDEHDGTPYLALEYLLGSTLEEFLRGGHELTLTQRVHIAREVALGLAAAHEHNVIHRDIKPENIWLEAPEGRVKLIDFGLARLPTQPSTATAEGTVMGTPAYMSPEQAKGNDSDPRSDLFSLGALMYRLLVGRIPFKGETPFATVLALSNDPHVPVIIENPQVPPALSELVDQLLSKDAAHRPASAKEVAKELKRIALMIRSGEASAMSDGTGRFAATVIPVSADAADNAWAALDTDHTSATPSNSTRITQPPRHDLTPYYWIGGAVVLAGAALFAGISAFKGKPTASSAAPVEISTKRATPVKSTPKASTVDPFTPLFNGKDLAGWQAVTEGKIERWTLKDGLLFGDESSGAGTVLLHEKPVSKFELKLDYRWPRAGGDAGVLLFSDAAGQGGVEVQLVDDSDPKAIRGIRQFLGNNPKFRHGAFFGFKPSTTSNHRASSEWNSLKVTAGDRKLIVEENGQVVNEFDYAAIATRGTFKEKQPGLAAGSGHIGLQCLYGAVEFRNVKIKDTSSGTSP